MSQQGHEEADDHDHRTHRDQAGKFRAPACCLNQWGARIEAADTKAARNGGGDLRGTECRKLAIRIDVVLVAGGKNPGIEDDAGITDRRNADRHAQHLLQEFGFEPVKTETWQTGCHRSDRGHTLRLEIEDHNQQGADGHQHQCGRNLWKLPGQPDEHCGADRTQPQRPRMDTADVASDLDDRRDEIGGAAFKAHERRYLIDDQRDRDAVQKAHQDRSRQKIGNAAELHQARDQTDDPYHQTERHRQRGIKLRVAGRHRSDGRGNQRGGGGIGADDQVSRGAQKEIDRHRQKEGVQPHDRTEAGNLGIGKADRQGDRRDRQPRAKVVRQIGEAVGQKGPDAGQVFENGLNQDRSVHGEGWPGMRPIARAFKFT